jgi:cell division protein FtsL
MPDYQDIKKKTGSALDISTSDTIDEISEKNLEIAVKKGVRTPMVKVLLRSTLAILLVVSIGMFVTSLMKYSELQREKEALEEKVEEYENEIERLEYLIDCPVDYDYIVRIAREKLHLYLPDDIIYYNDTNK